MLVVVASAQFAGAQELSITVTPADDDLQKVLEASSRSRAALSAENSTPRDILAAAQGDYSALLGALYSEGYFSGTVSVRVDGTEAADISVFSDPQSVTSIDISVEPGDRFAFGELSIEPQTPATTLPPEFRTGEPARTGEIQRAVRGALRGWQDEGYPQAEVEDQAVIADHRQRLLDVDIDIAPGQQLRFGSLRVKGNSAVRTDRVAAVVGLPTGELVTPEQIREAERRLAKTGAFRSFVLVPDETPNPDGTLNFTAEVQEEKPRRLGFGAEFNSSDGIRLTATWFHRNISGAADRLRFNADVTRRISGQTEYEFEIGASYRRPAIITARDNLLGDFFLYQEDQTDYTESGISLSARVEREISDRLSVDGGILATRARTDFNPGVRNFDLFGPTGAVTWDGRDDANDTKRGVFAELNLFPFLGAQDANSGLRTTIDARIFQAFGADDGVVLAARGQIGNVSGAATGTMPERLLFYSGGSTTVRGHEFQSLGVDVAGRTLGGAGFVGAQLEARVAVRGALGVVGFYDYGYVSPRDLSSEGGNSHSGAGLGIRYATPIGPVRFDVAAPVTGEGSGVQYYIGIGQAF